MTNTISVCLIFVTLFCLSLARQVPKECSRGPEYWCQSLRNAADCGSVGHCTSTVWAKHNVEINKNEISDKFINLFNELKDIKDLMNEDYLAQRMKSACNSVRQPQTSNICKQETQQLEKYLMHVISSDVSADTLCRIVGMCNNMKVDNFLALNKKKTPETGKPKETLVGASRCTWGPSYWCSNFSTGRECKATPHCISRVWSNMKVPVDSDSICKICTDMVQQARDQLESNETQTELKEVFEGSCKLMPIKVVRKECIKLADDFVPELVETLASQMNPQIVCSVAGLCNSARIDNLLDRYNEQLQKRENCNNCKKVVTVARKKFDATSYDDFLVSLLKMCGKAGSLSDSCSMLVFKYYENILEAVKKDLEPRGVCHLTGQCVHMFHQHEEFDFKEENLTALSANDDVPCEFCEQVIQHLRDVLIANTTEMQFYKVLKGICSQTGSFKAECLSLVEQYYPVIYQYLVSDLKPKELCAMGGLCPNNGQIEEVAIVPLMPNELVIKAQKMNLTGNDEANSYKVKKENVRVLGIEPAPLPLERMFVALPQGKNTCSFCEYFLHYLQIELSNTETEERIKEVVEKACDRLPNSVSGECKQFVSSYGPAVVALLVQEIDPASVCPALGLCPTTSAPVRRVDINAGKSNCPLCLFAVLQLEAVLKQNRTEESIRAALDGLCNHLSAKLRSECVDFVDEYSDQLVEMLANNMDGKQICVYLKLCKGETDPLKITNSEIDKFHEKPHLRGDRNNRKKPMLPKELLNKQDGDIETNEIPDHTINGVPVEGKPSSVCVLCEFVMKEIDDQIKDKANIDEIKKIVHGVCQQMPKSVRTECDNFVEKYADLVISLLEQELNPEDVCKELKLCPNSLHNAVRKVKQNVLDCAVCDAAVLAVEVVADQEEKFPVPETMDQACSYLPAKYRDRCLFQMNTYGESVLNLLKKMPANKVCHKIGLCDANSGFVRMYREKRVCKS